MFDLVCDPPLFQIQFYVEMRMPKTMYYITCSYYIETSCFIGYRYDIRSRKYHLAYKAMTFIKGSVRQYMYQ